MNARSTTIEQHEHTNRLINATSPYLLQHAHNPVNWYEWGPEAFEAAREQDKPIFLSIGYSTCYWCHVMERESFENRDIAAIMNKNFINIKVDREQRLDVDEVYMTAVQGLTGHGGWPMSVFLEPYALKPFIAGTYFPPEDRYGRAGFASVLRQMAQAWQTQRDQALEQANKVADFVRQHMSLGDQPVRIGRTQVKQAVAQLMSIYDPQEGGFTGGQQRAPKFPMPDNLDFLIDVAWNNETARAAVRFTLERMAIGGIYDQIGGGFHRYSVDSHWTVPHFEKMLYDNGQLAVTYSRAYEAFGDDFFGKIARETLEYVLREMTDGGGAFYAAQDAEVDGREGLNYLWTAEQVREALTNAGHEDDIDFALNVYGLNDGPNFRDPHHPDDEPKNVLRLSDHPEKVAEQTRMSEADFYERLTRINQALLETRNERKQPHLDDKILTGWNGLMIAGFSEGGRVLNDDRYVDAAKQAVRFILEKMSTDDGGLYRSFRNGQPQVDGFLEDYAFFVLGLLALHGCTNDNEYLNEAQRLSGIARAKFFDDQNGAYFNTPEGQGDLFVRTKTVMDGAVPSANSMMAHNLVTLHEFTGERSFADDAVTTFRAISSTIRQHPVAAILSVRALHRTFEKLPAVAERINEGIEQARETDVTVRVSQSSVDLRRHDSDQLTIQLFIPEGAHISAHAPGNESLTPLDVRMVGGQGVDISVEYPQGERFSAAFSGQEMLVHTGTVELPITVKKTGDVRGEPQITLTYQMCTESECRQPVTAALPVEINPGTP